MKYAGIIENDISDCDDGIALSVWFQGCPFHCEGCHNLQTWDFSGGMEIDFSTLLEKVKSGILANGMTRNLSILGGEPLCPENRKYAADIIRAIKADEKFDDVLIYCWTGYTLEELERESSADEDIAYILKNVDVLVDGLFVLAKRDITLKLRGSSNQRIWKRINGVLTTAI